MTRFVDAVEAAAVKARDAADELNRLDGAAGDGDMGVTMSIAAASVIDLVPELRTCEIADALRRVGARIARDAPSTSGTLVATALLGAAREATDGTLAVGALLSAASDAVAARGESAPGDKTMLDALAPAAAAATTLEGAGGPADAALLAAAEAADRGARATVAMTPKHGRAGWLAERSAGFEDPGARLVAIVLGAAAARVTVAGDAVGPS